MGLVHSCIGKLSGTKDWFHGKPFFHGLEYGVRGGSGLGMIQAHSIYCVLYFYYYYISSTSNHQALDPGGWGPLPQLIGAI